jgi:dTDP-4-dehydrorhamnose reductase
MKPTVLVTGKNGQLGNELQVLAGSYTAFHFIHTDRTELDITNSKQVDAFFKTNNISYCVNAAAYTAGGCVTGK